MLSKYEPETLLKELPKYLNIYDPDVVSFYKDIRPLFNIPDVELPDN